ncbi:MAG: NADP-dependent malic enzyme [Bacilli bacterium]|jgi:malate dehydrogenase (oxaloacetate-decarboxylating)|nr:NADP-dependent malic enzyme [Bacilli bacterium]MCH4235426.1 NADP-dependent malic enzyme [Bacilli bacterium]
MDIMDESLALHRQLKGKIEIKSKKKIKDMHDMSLVYTPGVASACLAIKNQPSEAYNLTAKSNTIAVISDGTAVLGLGDIGPLAAIPVMEGKAALFKRFAGLDAIPIVLNTKDVDELVETIYRLSPSFGGINLEDISAPRCFEVERRLKEMCDIPVFHDDQHGTAIVCGAALLNALQLVKKKIANVKIVINGAGSAGIAITKFLLTLGAKNIVVCDRFGIVVDGDDRLNSAQKEISKITNLNLQKGKLDDALVEADVFIGVSVGNVVSEQMIKSMNNDAIVFPLANPTPEISRDKALKAGARVVGTGVSNLPNQINNALVFPGLFKGALAARVQQITPQMEIAACKALAHIVRPSELNETYIIPNIFNRKVALRVAKAVMKAGANE